MNQAGEHYHRQRGLYHLWLNRPMSRGHIVPVKTTQELQGQWWGQDLPRRKQPVKLCCYRGTRSVSLTRKGKGKRRPKKLPSMMWLKLPPSSWPSRFSRITLSKKPKDEEDVVEEEEMAVTKDAKDNVDTCEWLVSRCLRRRIVMTRPAMLLWIIELSFICSQGINCFAMLFPFRK